MSYQFIKKWSPLLLPAGLLLAVFAVLQRLPLLPAPQRELFGYAPYLALCVGLTLSLAFNRGRVLLALLVVALCHLLTRNHLQQGMELYAPRTLYLFSSILIPVNLTLFCFMKERGVFTHAGRLRLGFLLLQLLALFWVARFPGDYGALPELIGRPLTGASLVSGGGLPHSSLLLFFFAFLMIGLRAVKRRYPIDLALLGTLVALGIALNRAFSEELPALFVTAAALLLAMALLQDSHSMAFSDDLTGLPSRRALNEQVMGLPRRFCVAMLDVDHFKRFNDSYGHEVGDQVLKMVGARIAAVKGGGKPFRYGGEEFTIIFPGKGVKEVTPHLEELRRSIEAYRLWIRGNDRPKEADAGKAKRSQGRNGDGKTASVTVSIGVAASSEERRAPSEVIASADRALYRAKQQGRNRIVA